MASLDQSSMMKALVVAFLTTGLLCLTALIAPAGGIMCYQCIASMNAECQLPDQAEESTLMQECSNYTGMAFCRTIEIVKPAEEYKDSCAHHMPSLDSSPRGNGTEACDVNARKAKDGNATSYRLVRDCGQEKFSSECYTVIKANVQERICQCFSDGCNAGTKMQADVVLHVLLVIAASMALLNGAFLK